jgi:hypothetical protein
VLVATVTGIIVVSSLVLAIQREGISYRSLLRRSQFIAYSEISSVDLTELLNPVLNPKQFDRPA